MNPCELNLIVAAITNYLYAALSKKDFLCLGILLRELSKSMLTTTVFEDICQPDKGK